MRECTVRFIIDFISFSINFGERYVRLIPNDFCWRGILCLAKIGLSTGLAPRYMETILECPFREMHPSQRVAGHGIPGALREPEVLKTHCGHMVLQGIPHTVQPHRGIVENIIVFDDLGVLLRKRLGDD